MKNLILKTSPYIRVISFLIVAIAVSIVVIWNGIKNHKDKEIASSCNTVLIKINGEIVEYKSADKDTWTDETVSNDIVAYLDNAENDPATKAVILEINSGGGSPVGGQIIANALKRMTKPTVALIQRMGDSSAYWLATGASKIFASDLSDIGNIGIISEQWEQTKKDKKDGYTYTILTSDKYKSIGSYHSVLTEDDKKLLIRDLMKSHDIFVDAVAENRHLDRGVVAKLADGSSVMGEDALKAGLIDQIGDLFDVKSYMAETIGENVSVCEY